ncbi:MAG: hypothetical protein L6R28_19365 [Planctomycetes bacterium]|nr:hypothetical protein [Planctomycetota bacterium]
MIVPFVLVWILLLSAFGYTFYREVKRTPWDLLESLVLFTVLGHVLALPIAHANRLVEATQEAPDFPLRVGTVALAVAMFMAGGAVWVFRRLNRLGERRRVRRIMWMIPGLLLFPSMLGPWFAPLYAEKLTVPVFAASGIVWLLMANLNARTNALPDQWPPVKGRRTAAGRGPCGATMPPRRPVPAKGLLDPSPARPYPARCKS